jgi:hypothetical protein
LIVEGDDDGVVVEVVMHVDEAETPRSSSSSPLSSVAPSVASSVSEAEVDDDVELESRADDEITTTQTSPNIPDGLEQNHPHMHPGHQTGDKPLTRRQRKALGLPKLRKAGLSAGKIVIPGGKWKGSGDGAEPTTAVLAADNLASEEWRRNGTGRVDVRGFRELKI